MNETFDDIIQRLRAQEPELQDAEMLTDAIMANLPDLKPKKSLRIYHVLSAVAATILALIYVWQSVGADVKAEPRKDYEQCIAKYKRDWNFDGCTDLRAVGRQYARIRESQKSLANRLKTEHYEKD